MWQVLHILLLFLLLYFLFLVGAQYSFYIRPYKRNVTFRRFYFVTSHTLKIQKCRSALCERNEYG